MYFTESDSASCEDPFELNDEFEAQYEMADCEVKTSRLLHHAYDVKMMGENNIGPIFVELQQAADQSLSKPFPLGASHDKFGLGFQSHVPRNEPGPRLKRVHRR